MVFGASGLSDRQFDVYITGGIPPYPQVEQLAMTAKMCLLGLTKAQVYHASKRELSSVNRLGRYLDKIPAKSYQNVETNGDVNTAGALVGVVARMDLDEDTVYKITKTFWENLPKEVKNAPYLKRIALERALSADNMKFHPGALRYYREIGLVIPKAME